MITLLIKGDKYVAAQAAKERGLSFRFICETCYCNRLDTIAHTDADHTRITAWFGEVTQVPFPLGTLLHFTED